MLKLDLNDVIYGKMLCVCHVLAVVVLGYYLFVYCNWSSFLSSRRMGIG
jgi:hypothetical protein